MRREALVLLGALLGAPVLGLAAQTLLESPRLGLVLAGAALSGASALALCGFWSGGARWPAGLAERKLVVVAALMTAAGLGAILAGALAGRR